jgi:hypothetical protein
VHSQQSAKEAVAANIKELIDELPDEFIDPDQFGALLPEEENE